MHVEPDKKFGFLIAKMSPWNKSVTENQCIGTFLLHPYVSAHSGVAFDSRFQTYDLEDIYFFSDGGTEQPWLVSVSRSVKRSDHPITVVARNMSRLKSLSRSQVPQCVNPSVNRRIPGGLDVAVIHLCAFSRALIGVLRRLETFRRQQWKWEICD